MTHTNWSSPDPIDQVVLLDDHHALAWTVTRTGARWPWLLAPAPDGQRPDGCTCPTCAPHEQTGPLPTTYQWALQQPFRCSGTTTAGWPCRAAVGQHAARCRHQKPGGHPVIERATYTRPCPHCDVKVEYFMPRGVWKTVITHQDNCPDVGRELKDVPGWKSGR